MDNFLVCGSPVTVLKDGDGPVIFFVTDRGEEAQVLPELEAQTGPVLSWQVPDWNRDLSPWPEKGLFRGGNFGGGAGRVLEELKRELSVRGADTPMGIAGYSLAGLFALYALFETGLFQGAASASGSLWYPGFLEYAKDKMKEGAQGQRRCVYLSLGEREPKARNPVMQTVGANTQAVYDLLAAQKETRCHFQWNPGGHFDDPGKRTAHGINWLWHALSER